MNMSFTRIQAIFMKDYKEFSRNYAVSVMVFLPLILAFLTTRLARAVLMHTFYQST
ncbi:ABC-2 type transporter transmembrane domain-containing protein OS=Lysinibacillus sphaericus OX=1421 GN=LYSIN_03142 PE=4 SV=1 [Lysinibacillus sphaericus]